MKPVRFVHAADLHLGSQFKGLASWAPELKAEMVRAMTKAFDAIIDLCLEREVDFAVFAGDIYEGPGRNFAAQRAFRDGIARLDAEGISSFVAHGNHDPLSHRFLTLSWPESVHAFRAGSVESVPFANRDGETVAVIHGISYREAVERDRLAGLFPPGREGLLNVGVLHCNVEGRGGHEDYAPCSAAELRASGMDYWALGHVHVPQDVIEGDPLAVYAGIPQGRHIGEAGPRGCYLVTSRGPGDVEREFVPVDSVRWMPAEVSIEGLTDPDRYVEQLLDRTRETFVRLSGEASGRVVVARIALTGRGPLHEELRSVEDLDGIRGQLAEDGLAMAPRVVLEELRDSTRKDVDVDRVRDEDSIRGEFLRTTAGLAGDEELRGELITLLEGVYGIKVEGRRVLTGLDERTLAQIVAEAESLGLDELTPEEPA